MWWPAAQDYRREVDWAPGHAGPDGDRRLPLLLGKFTRLAQYFSSAEKSYTGAIRFGFSTDTYDAEGEAAGPDLWPEGPALTLEQVRGGCRGSMARWSRCRRLLRKEDWRHAGLQAGARGQAGGTEDGEGHILPALRLPEWKARRLFDDEHQRGRVCAVGGA
jgi:hypothetical protein